jgi:hypothetical protein
MRVAGLLERDPVWAFAPFTDRMGAPAAVEPVVVPPELGPVRTDQNVETAAIGDTVVSLLRLQIGDANGGERH